MNRTFARLIWPISSLLLLILINTFFTQGFYKITVDANGHYHGIIIDVFYYGARVMLLALPMTLVIATGGVDLSVGAVMAIAGATAAMLMSASAFENEKYVKFLTQIHLLEHPEILGIIAAFVVCAIAGFVNGTLVSWFGIQPIIATLILMVAGRGIAQLIGGTSIISFTNGNFKQLDNGFILNIPIPIWAVVIAFCLIWLIARRTALGVMIESLGDNPEAARYVGIPVRVIKISVYVLCGIIAAAAGLIDTASVSNANTYQCGLNMELDAILAVVIGGTALTGGRFYLVGSLLGAILIQLLNTTLLLHSFKPEILTLPKAILVVVVCTLQSPRISKLIQSARASRAVKVAA